jgi:hypothetical protein
LETKKLKPMGVSNWTTVKPKRFKEDCLLLTASWIDYWDYTLFEIKRTFDYDDNDKQIWYWGIFKDCDEWGDYVDLKADRYRILPMLKIKNNGSK